MTWNPSVNPGAHKYEDRNDDFYQTPEVATLALLRTGELNRKRIWEPACGAGAISKVLEQNGYIVTSTDLRDRGYGQGGIDFLQSDNYQFGTVDIVTNPPFKYADDFILKALELTDKAVMLLRWPYAQGLDGAKRGSRARSIIMDEHCSRAYLFIERLPMMHREGYTGKKHNSSAMAHAWFVFERQKQHAGFLTQRISWKAALGKAQGQDKTQSRVGALCTV